MKSVVHVLSIGSVAPWDGSCDGCFEQRGFAVAVAEGYRELLQTVMGDEYEVAVLQEALSQEELLQVAHFIRRRWPAARILIIRQEEWWLDDALYDDRVVPDANPELLLSAVERLASLVMRPTAERQAESGYAG
jgi:hypothetical protein